MKYFKTSSSVFLLLIFFIFQSCNNETMDPSPNGNGLLGDWQALELNATFDTETNFDGQVYESSSVIEGSNFNYIVNFDGLNFTTQGGYDITSTTTAFGQPDFTETQSYSDVSGNGTYMIDGNEMTINGSFYEIDGMGVDGAAPQTTTFHLSADGQTLTFVQNEQITQAVGDISTVSTINSTSVFVKL